ncbi:MAG: hypothetical protein V1857_04765 [archaeon]
MAAEQDTLCRSILLALQSERIPTTAESHSRRAKTLSILILLAIVVGSAGSYLMFYRGTTSQTITITPVVTTAVITQTIVTASTATERTTTQDVTSGNHTIATAETSRTTPRTQLAMDEQLLRRGQKLRDEPLSEAYIPISELAQRSQHGAERHD